MDAGVPLVLLDLLAAGLPGVFPGALTGEPLVQPYRHAGACRLAEEIHPVSFHMSGKQKLESGMRYRNPQIIMGLPGLGEFDIFRTEEAQIKKAREAMDKIK